MRVLVAEKMVIPGRSETLIQVKCDTKTAFLERDFFAPATIAGMTGIYSSKTGVIPNSAGVFTISLLNVSAEDKILTVRKPMGTLHASTSENITSGSSKDTPLFDF